MMQYAYQETRCYYRVDGENHSYHQRRGVKEGWELASHGRQRVGKVISPYVLGFLSRPRLTFFLVAWHPPAHQ